MKKIMILILFAIPLVIYSQTKSPSLNDKVKAGVRRYLYLTMKDYSSYKPVEWGKINIIYTSYYATDRCRSLLDSINKIKKPYLLDYEAWSARREASGIDIQTDSILQSYVKLLTPIQEKINPILKTIEKETSTFKKSVIGYSVYHSYRGKNSYGAYTIGYDTFTLNKGFKVESTESEDEDDS